MTTDQAPASSWKRCGVCKKDLAFGGEFYECSVSTCTSGPRHPVFCSVRCWEQHVPVMRHRDAWAEQKTSPTRAQWEALQSQASESTPSAPVRRIVAGSTPAAAPAPRRAAVPQEVLIVASKLKAYVRARSGMNS